MEGYSYTNIFETKGIEYVAIVVFFLFLIPFWLILNRQIKPKKQLKIAGNLTANSLRIPQGIFFSRLHTWAHLEKSGMAKVGLDDLVVRITGEVNFVSLQKSGDKVKKGDLIAEIEQNGKKLRIYSPISGEILRANAALANDRELLNEDPYGKGWMFEIKPISWVADTNSYFVAEDATSWAVQELDRFKDFLSASLGQYSPAQSNVVLQDGGELRDQPLADHPIEVWQNFQHDFLSKKELCQNKSCFRITE